MGDETREQSQDSPLLWRRPWWSRPAAVAAAWGCLIIYGSLIPFDLNVGGFPASDDAGAGAAWAWVTAPRWTTGSGRSPSGIRSALSDLATNLALYAPLGVALRLALAKRVRGAWMQVGLAAGLLALMSWSIECTQALSPSRYASLNDFAANASAGAAGAAAAVRLREAARRLLFDLHRCVAPIALPLLDWMRSLRRCRSGPMRAAGVTGGLVLLAAIGISASGGVELRPPFMSDFRLSYDAAAATLAGRAVMYALLAALLSLGLARQTPGRSLVQLTVATGLIAAGAQAWRGQGVLDLTEPALAAAAAAGTLAAAFVLVHCVRRGCRRRREVPVAQERRRRGHDYRFAIR